MIPMTTRYIGEPITVEFDKTAAFQQTTALPRPLCLGRRDVSRDGGAGPGYRFRPSGADGRQYAARPRRTRPGRPGHGVSAAMCLRSRPKTAEFRDLLRPRAQECPTTGRAAGLCGWSGWWMTNANDGDYDLIAGCQADDTVGLTALGSCSRVCCMITTIVSRETLCEIVRLMGQQTRGRQARS